MPLAQNPRAGLTLLLTLAFLSKSSVETLWAGAPSHPVHREAPSRAYIYPGRKEEGWGYAELSWLSRSG